MMIRLHILDIFIETCRKSYVTYITIDEQLMAFRGRCPLRMDIPNKPAKYGIKIIMVCESSTKYMIDANSASLHLEKKQVICL